MADQTISRNRAVIVRGIGGQYTLHRHDPPFLGLAWLRGALRLSDIRPLVGDHVTFSEANDPDVPYVVDEILKRKNVSLRPAVANIDQLLITVSIAGPSPDELLVDRLIVYARSESIEPVLLINKIDLIGRRRPRLTLERLRDNYRRAGLQIFELGLTETEDLGMLKEYVTGKVVAFAGQSGAGKSSILNRLFGEEKSQIGEISQKIARGRHTTRETTLFPVSGGGYVADTPGFSVLSLGAYDLDFRDLQQGYAELSLLSDHCRFADCRHDGDEGCMLDECLIPPDRLSRYRYLLAEVADRQLY
jgi:ribosome biogenesis GTPase